MNVWGLVKGAWGCTKEGKLLTLVWEKKKKKKTETKTYKHKMIQERAAVFTHLKHSFSQQWRRIYLGLFWMHFWTNIHNWNLLFVGSTNAYAICALCCDVHEEAQWWSEPTLKDQKVKLSLSFSFEWCVKTGDNRKQKIFLQERPQ